MLSKIPFEKGQNMVNSGGFLYYMFWKESHERFAS